MLTRVETLKRNGAVQTGHFHSFEERLQRLEDLQTSTVVLLNALVQNLQTTSANSQALGESISSRKSNKKSRETDDEELLTFTALSTPEEPPLPAPFLLSSGGRPIRSASFTGRKPTAPLPVPASAPPQIVVGAYGGLSAFGNTEERLGIGATALSASSTSVNVVDDTSQPALYQAEETENKIYEKLIKDRFRKISEFVEDIERTLPSHQARYEGAHEKCDTTDDDETLSAMDWVDPTGRTTYNSTRVSRYDVNQEEHTPNLLVSSKIRLVLLTVDMCEDVFQLYQMWTRSSRPAYRMCWFIHRLIMIRTRANCNRWNR